MNMYRTKKPLKFFHGLSSFGYNVWSFGLRLSLQRFNGILWLEDHVGDGVEHFFNVVLLLRSRFKHFQAPLTKKRLNFLYILVIFLFLIAFGLVWQILILFEISISLVRLCNLEFNKFKNIKRKCNCCWVFGKN